MSTLPSSYVDNTPTPPTPATVGFKISKPGYDARRTAGNNYVYNSNWPSLPIAFQATIANPITGGASTGSVLHNLNFPPLTFIWAIGPDPSGIGMTARRINVMADVDKTTVYLKASGLSGIESDFLYTATKLHIKCFLLDLSKDQDYDLAAGDTFNAPYDNNYGIKVAKPNKDITSVDMRDYSLHSRCQSPLILAVKTQATVSPSNPGTVQYTTKLNYPVWVYGYKRQTSNGRYAFAPYDGNGGPRIFTDGFRTYNTFGTSTNGATIVVLRDPMFAATQVTGQY